MIQTLKSGIFVVLILRPESICIGLMIMSY